MTTSLNRQLQELDVNKNTTPSSNSTARKTRAGDERYEQEQLHAELAMDLAKADKCSFDQLLKYFQYLVLDPDSKEKKNLDNLQHDIEKLQFQRLYGEKHTRNDNTADETEEAAAAREAARKAALAKEEELIKQRDDYQTDLLERLLQVTLLVANQTKFKQLLLELDEGFREGNEVNRYPPFVALSNALLDELKRLPKPHKSTGLSKLARERNVNLDLPFRAVDPLDIRFQVNHPNHINFRYHGTTVTVERNPDVILTSRFALARHLGLSNEWVMVLLSGEFKRRFRHRRTFHGELEDILAHNFQLTLMEEHSQDEIKALDSQAEEAAEGEQAAGLEGNFAMGDDDEEEEYILTDGSHIPPKSKRTRRLAGPVADKEQPAAKKIKPLPTPSASGSRSITSVPAHEVEEPDTNQEAVAGRVQCASYALEMLSYSIGVHHAINILFTDGILWVWYYDRQGIIQSTGISLFKDFPRFIALLFVFQRFTLADWGIIPELNPGALSEHGQQTSKAKVDLKYPIEVTLQGQSGPSLENYKDFASFWQGRGDESAVALSKVKLNADEFRSHQPHCIAGRATAVVPAVGLPESGLRRPKPMVCKVYHPEFQRRHEGLTTDVVYAIAQADELDKATKAKKAEVGDWNMFNHLPKLYFYGDLKGTSTHLVRSMVNCDWKGHRTARMIGMKELQKVTTLEGWDFVKAWLDAVTCHAFLWKNHVEHGDPSLGNVMYDEETKSGVLTDFDLSLLQWEPRVLGTERTGTVPFVAIDLLCDDYWKVGTLARHYYHELESFIWILPYVFLLFKKGEQLKNPLVDPWRTGDYDVCSKEKLHFLKHGLNHAGKSVQQSYADCWGFASRLIEALRDFQSAQDVLKTKVSKARLQVDPKNPFLVIQPSTDASTKGGTDTANQKKDDEVKIMVQASENLWNDVFEIIKLLKLAEGLGFAPLMVDRLDYYHPSFKPLKPSEEETLRNRFRDILYPPSVTIEAEAPSP